MTAEQQRLWDVDPSPSFEQIAEAIGVEPPHTSPSFPASDIEWQIQAFWPRPPECG